MRAVAVSHAERRIGIVDQPEPAVPGPRGVLAEVLEVGICGTDRDIARFEYGSAPAGCDHLVLGHESLARVVATGPDVDDVARGDLVVPMVRRPCPDPECLPCRAKRQDFCATGGYTERGIKGSHGFLTELVADDAGFLVRVPPELRAVGVLTEPLTIVEKALESLRRIQDSRPWRDTGYRERRALVLGAGPVGLLGAMALIHAGFRAAVYSRSRPPNPKAGLVESVGGRYLSSLDHGPGELAGIIGPADVVYEATGVPGTALEATAALAPNGILLMTGVPGHGPPVRLDAAGLMRRLVLGNQVVVGTVNAGRAAYERAVVDLRAFNARWPRQLASLITGRSGIEQAPDLLAGTTGGIKEVVVLAR